MGTPYEIRPMVTETVVGATPFIVAIPWPHRSVISKIIIVTKDGVSEAFTAEFFNHPMVDSGEAVSDSDGPEGEVGQIPEECFRVTPPIVANSSGRIRYFSEESTGGYGYVFYNHKEPNNRQGQREGILYLRLTPVSGGTHRYAIVISGMKELE